eukprot:EG_transcript_16710
MAGYPSANDFAPAAPRGGFIASPAAESPSQKTFRAADQQTLTPVTIRMLLTAHQGSDEVFRVDNQPLVQVTFVGKVVASDTSNRTNIAYRIDDGTGIMDVKVWLENDDAGMTQVRDAEPTDSYVRVYGHLRQWNKSLNVVAFRLKPIENSNEITYHFLEVIRVHLHHTKGPLPPATAQDAAAATTPSKVPPGGLPGPTPPHHQPAPQQFSMQLPEVQQDILRVIMAAPNPDLGASRQTVISGLSHKWPAPVLAQSLHQMLSDALIFTTLDDDHFKATDSDF